MPFTARRKVDRTRSKTSQRRAPVVAGPSTETSSNSSSDSDNIEEHLNDVRKRRISRTPAEELEDSSENGNATDDTPQRKKVAQSKKPNSRRKKQEREDDDSFDSADDQISDATKDDSADEDFLENSASEDEDGDEAFDTDDSPPPKRKPRRHQRKKLQSGRSRQSRKAAGTRRKKGNARKESDDTEEEESEASEGVSEHNGKQPRTRHSPSRRSARKATARLQKYKSDDEVQVYPKRKSKNASDEEFQANEDSSSDSSALNLSGDEESEPGVGVVRDEDVGTVDESSDDEKPQWRSPQLKVQRTNRTTLHVHEENVSSQSSEEENLPMESPPKLPPCGSTEDAITNEELPKKHVCFFTPDGETRCCFALETLRRVALMRRQEGQPLYNPDGTLAFLQPPHFRTVMSDDLVDQIASRFGREAVDINGPYYAKKDGAPVRPWEVVSSDEEGDEEFQERVKKFVKTVMGSRDLYVCPLCYTAAYNRAEQAGRTREGDVTDRYELDFYQDPMSTLGSPDDSKFEVASTFCFNAVAKVKKHLRIDHGVDVRGLTGSFLYTRFQIRSPDGLLQRYMSKHGTVYQGNLQRYWFEGNNYDFVYLTENVDAAHRYRMIVAAQKGDYSDEQIEEAKEFLLNGQNFVDAFAGDAHELWEYLSSPYRSDAKDIEDFVADEEEEEVGPSAQDAYREQERERLEEDMEEFAEQAERYRRMDEEDEYQRQSSEMATSEEEDEEDQESEEGEEEDPWIADKRRSFEQRRLSGTPAKRGRRPPSPQENSSSSSEELDDPRAGSRPRRDARLSIADSDDEPTERSSKRRSVLDVDDE